VKVDRGEGEASKKKIQGKGSIFHARTGEEHESPSGEDEREKGVKTAESESVFNQVGGPRPDTCENRGGEPEGGEMAFQVIATTRRSCR